MPLKSFNQAISSAFSLADSSTKILKEAFIGLCSDVDRYFRLSFNLDIYASVNENEFYVIKGTYPNFRKLTLEQFNRLLFTFISIRDDVAHLFLNKIIYIDDDIKDFISGLIEPKYALTNNGEVTLFGAICICLLFSQPYQLSIFNTGAIRHNIFYEIPKDTMPDFQRAFQKSV